MASAATESLDRLAVGRAMPSPATERSAPLRLGLVVLGLLGLLAWGLYDAALGEPLDRAAWLVTEQGKPVTATRFDGWGKWGGYAR